MDNQNLIDEAVKAFRKEYGTVPNRTNYKHCRVWKGQALFAASEVALDIFIRSQKIKRRLAVCCVCFLCFMICYLLAVVICGKMGLEQTISFVQTWLIVGVIISLLILLFACLSLFNFKEYRRLYGRNEKVLTYSDGKFDLITP